jgi:S1-C subfamily serine protease
MMSFEDKNVLMALSDAMSAAVVKAGVSTLMVSGRRRFPASGIGYAPDLILTANHVLERDEEISVGLPDGGSLQGRTVGRDPGSDLALVRVEKSAILPAERAQDAPRIGQFVLAVGRPGPEGLQASFGVISAVGGPVRTGRGSMLERYLRSDAISYPGFSGGPLVDGEGRVVGLNTSGFGPGNPIAIPADLAWKVAEALQHNGHIKRGYLGIRSQQVELPEDAQQKLGRKQEVGLLVVGLERGGSASEGGLIVGDILAAMNGVPLEDHDALLTHLTGDVVGMQAAFEILRGGQPVVVHLRVGEHS